MTKKDTEAKGARRTLQCLCPGNNFETNCPFMISQDILTKVEKFNGTGTPLALAKQKRLAKKAEVIKTWKWLYGKGSQATLVGAQVLSRI